MVFFGAGILAPGLHDLNSDPTVRPQRYLRRPHRDQIPGACLAASFWLIRCDLTRKKGREMFPNLTSTEIPPGIRLIDMAEQRDVGES